MSQVRAKTGLTARELADVVELLRAVARAEIMPRFRHLGPGAVRSKSGPLDLVTDADEQAEARITTGLQQLFPGVFVVGEEAAATEPGLLSRLPDADLAFVVDPIDGTANFCAGLPLFGVMLAMLRRGEVIAGIIHDPVCDDTAIALRGEGAWMQTPDGTRTTLRVAPAVPVAAMSGAASWRYMAQPNRTTVCRNLPRMGAVWDLRCAAHEYRMIAAGHCHFLLFQRLMPWDHAAGWLLHREAGGWSARLDGSPYSPIETTGGLLCAPDRASWEALRATMFEGAGGEP